MSTNRIFGYRRKKFDCTLVAKFAKQELALLLRFNVQAGTLSDPLNVGLIPHEQEPVIFSDRFSLATSLAAQNIVASLVTTDSVTEITQWTDYETTRRGRETEFLMGDACAGDIRDLQLSLHIPGLKELGPVPLAVLSVSFMEIYGGRVISTVVQGSGVHVRLSDEASSKGPQPEIVTFHPIWTFVDYPPTRKRSRRSGRRA